VVEAERGIANWVDTGAYIHVPTWSAFLADAALASGNLPLAERALTSGIAIAQGNGELFALAELQRLRGGLLVLQSRRGDAYNALADAVATSRSQGAHLYLLRAARDLARLIVEDADPDRACKLLQPIVEDFPEHRNGSDLRETAELLATL
jgi:predicted ATPase